MDMRLWGVALLLFLMPAASVWGQQYSADKPVGTAAQAPPAFLKKAGVNQNLGNALPLKDRFIESNGTEVPLGAFFEHRPVVMALVYYKCKMLCPQVLSGLAKTLRSVGFTPGKDYDVVITSIDPMDTPADGAVEKTRFLESLGAPDAGSSVHFLTGQQAAITDLASATGFNYVRVPGPDGKMDQFAHSSVIMIATPDGRMSKYLFGIDYQPRDVRLAVIQASTHHIGSLSDMILLYCCNYSPSAGKYTVSVLRVMGLAAMGSLFMLGAMFYALSRKPKRTVTHA
ncbi:MAG TPA: SCO family protein [Acidobacteriaceae bacterium]|nr:SCO family protein [Acidobacteriaceae bacterium]